uniref:Xylose isomerase n=1 Tax=Streptomyces lividans TaxID=1916 RepID=XYLA_STRLI|nr:RecName: Full=Xylose isomerase [Streptomyces lividans]AAF25626.1 xylose isomerase [Streptomyces lividans TK24]
MNYQPTSEDRFTFGLWTVGWQGLDPFGDATREALDPAESVRRLSQLGAYGVTFHDDELIPFGSSDNERGVAHGAGVAHQAVPAGAGRDRHEGADGDDEPVHAPGCSRDGAFTANDRDVRGTRCARAIRNIDLAVEHVARASTCAWGGREGAESGAAKDVRDALDRMKEAFDLLGEYVTEQGYDLKFAIEPKPNEPRGDILLPTVGHALAFIERLERPELYGVNPEVGHEQMAGLNFPHGIAQALWAGKLFHIDLNGQSGIKYDQDLRFGAGDLRAAFWLVDLLERAGYAGPRHFDFKPPRTENFDAVWPSAAGCMRNYLILKDRAAAFRADPQVQEALAAARLDELARPTAEDGLAALLADRSAYDTFDVDAAAARGMAFEHLDQLAMDHLLGAR